MPCRRKGRKRQRVHKTCNNATNEARKSMQHPNGLAILHLIRRYRRLVQKPHIIPRPTRKRTGMGRKVPISGNRVSRERNGHRVVHGRFVSASAATNEGQPIHVLEVLNKRNLSISSGSHIHPDHPLVHRKAPWPVVKNKNPNGYRAAPMHGS